jgi:ABC-2 type transport system permease protein
MLRQRQKSLPNSQGNDMKHFIYFIKKEFLHIFRDSKSLIILFGLPIIQIILFGFALTNEIKNVDFAVYDNSHTEVSQRLINKLNATDFFTLQENITNPDKMEDLLIANKVKFVLVIDKDFARASQNGEKGKIQLLLDASDPNIATNIRAYLNSIIADFESDESASLATSNMMTVKMFYNPQVESAYLFIPGLIAFILTLISAFMTSITLVREKELGNMEILLISPLKPYQIIIGKVIPYAILSIVNIANILLLGKFMFGMPLNGSLLLLCLESLLFLLNSLALGILISSFTNSRQVAMMVALAGLLLPTMLLSGFIFPINNMPQILQYFAQIIPATHFIIILKGIMIKGIGISYLLKETAILAFLTILFIMISIKKFNVRLDK